MHLKICFIQTQNIDVIVLHKLQAFIGTILYKMSFNTTIKSTLFGKSTKFVPATCYWKNVKA